MCRPQHDYLSKAQTQQLMDIWECTEPIPKRGQKVLVAFPCRGDTDVDLVEIERTGLKGNDRGNLYRITLSSRTGRALETGLQDAHVQTYDGHGEVRHVAATAVTNESRTQ